MPLVNGKTKLGFQISQSKTVGIIFGDKKETSVSLFLDNKPIKFQTNVKFLGLIFDKHLTWKHHFQYLVERSKPIINLLG